jgi:hypothetical protein
LLGRTAFEQETRAMTPDAATVFTARSQPKMVGLVALVAVTIFITYMGLSAFETILPPVAWPSRLERLPPIVGIVFLALAAVSLAATVWQVRRRLNPYVDVVADAEGIASRQSFWRRDHLAWSEITGFASGYPSLLYIYGISTTGNVKCLVIDTAQIDVSAADVYAVITRHRPDLFSKPRS